jgi:protocatechuate 3,4-dioxygenase beta subunit
MRPFVTQIYVADEPGNSEDFLFRRIPAEHRQLVLAAQFDLILMPSTAQAWSCSSTRA